MNAYEQTAAAFTSLHQQVMERHEERMMEIRRQVDDLTFRVACVASMAGIRPEAEALGADVAQAAESYELAAEPAAEPALPRFRVGDEVRVIAPRFPPDANRGKVGRIVAAFDFPVTQAHYHVEIDGVVYDYDRDELEEPGRAIARALAGFTVVTSGTGLPTDRAA